MGPSLVSCLVFVIVQNGVEGWFKARDPLLLCIAKEQDARVAGCLFIFWCGEVLARCGGESFLGQRSVVVGNR